jgi:hypothetical protein
MRMTFQRCKSRKEEEKLISNWDQEKLSTSLIRDYLFTFSIRKGSGAIVVAIAP